MDAFDEHAQILRSKIFEYYNETKFVEFGVWSQRDIKLSDLIKKYLKEHFVEKPISIKIEEGKLYKCRDGSMAICLEVNGLTSYHNSYNLMFRFRNSAREYGSTFKVNHSGISYASGEWCASEKSDIVGYWSDKDD